MELRYRTAALLSRRGFGRRKPVLAKLRPDQSVYPGYLSASACACPHADRCDAQASIQEKLRWAGFFRRANISNGPRIALYHSKIQVVEYFFDHIRILCKRNYSHFRRTFRTQKWINFPSKNGGKAPIFCINHAQFFR